MEAKSGCSETLREAFLFFFLLFSFLRDPSTCHRGFWLKPLQMGFGTGLSYSPLYDNKVSYRSGRPTQTLKARLCCISR